MNADNVTMTEKLYLQAFELLNPGEGLRAKATFASDVYALGMVCIAAAAHIKFYINSQQ